MRKGQGVGEFLLLIVAVMCIMLATAYAFIPPFHDAIHLLFKLGWEALT